MAEVCVAVGRREARIEAGQAPSSPELSLEEDEDGDPMLMTETAMEEADEEQALGSACCRRSNTTTWCSQRSRRQCVQTTTCGAAV